MEPLKLTPFGQICVDGRMRMTMTRPELAKLVNCSPAQISRIESGQIEPPAHYVVLVTQILGLDLAEVEATLATPESPFRLTRITQPRYGSQQ
jgi:transcriptional regulator with XRE-family HTH domain